MTMGTRFGLALPKWIIEDETSKWISLGFTLLCMVPIIVGLWWYRPFKFSKDQVLLETTRLFFEFFQKEPNMTLKKVIMVLAASFEFDKSHNSEIVERPSDNEEVPQLMQKLPNLDEKYKEKLLCDVYSVKARALLHAHFSRLELPPSTLEVDRRYLLKKYPSLISEMVNVISQLATSCKGRQPHVQMPILETVEKCMNVSQMIIQALEKKSSPLLQLPHIRTDMLRHFDTKQRNIQRIKDLALMEEEDRRTLLQTLTDDEYRDVMHVCDSMPHIEMIIKSEDDEDFCITPGSIVTVMVTLKRHNLVEVEVQQDQEEAVHEEKEEEEEEEIEGKASTDADQEEEEENSEPDDEVEEPQEEFKKVNTLVTKKMESWPVYCPYYPGERKEGWWIFVGDRKHNMLISAPVYIQSLKYEEEIQLTFLAPHKVGVYTYSIILKSDSYMDFDQIQNLTLDVNEANVDEEEKEYDDNVSEDSDFSTDAYDYE